MTPDGMKGKSHRAPLKYKPGTSAADRPASPEQRPQAQDRPRRTAPAVDRRPLRTVDIMRYNDNTTAARPWFTVGRRDFLPPGGGSTSPQKLQLNLRQLQSIPPRFPTTSVPIFSSRFRFISSVSCFCTPLFSENQRYSSHTPPHTFLDIKKSVMFQRYRPRHILTRFHAFGNEKGVIWHYKINFRNSPQLHHVPGDRTMVRFSGRFHFSPIHFPYF